MERGEKWLEAALERLQPSRSRETGLLYREPPFQAVCFEENLLFSLLLFRKKHKDTILEGKKILAHLLEFQIKEENSSDFGSFPVDIVDFPRCNDRTLPARAAFLLEIITVDFGAVLGADLSAKVYRAKEFLLSFLKKHWQAFPWPSVERLYIELLYPEMKEEACCLQSFLTGAVFSGSKIACSAKAKTNSSACLGIPDPRSLGRMVAALDYFPASRWKEMLLEQANLFWDEKSRRYSGPASGVYQLGTRQACSLFDCWVALQIGVDLDVSWNRGASLELALLRPGGNLLKTMAKKTVQKDEYALFCLPEGTLTALFTTPRSHLLNGFSPLRFVTEHFSMAWKFPHGKLLSFRQEGKKFYGAVAREETHNAVLFEVFVERLPGVAFFVEGKKGSLFNPFQGISVHVGKSSWKISLHPFQGEALGLVCVGNRPSQLLDVKEEAFDWVVTCEQIRGEPLKEFSFCMEMQ